MTTDNSQYPNKWSTVTVTFTDGEVKNYLISAGPSIGGYLAREAGSSGILSLFNPQQSWAIPLANIRDWSISEYVAPAPAEKSKRGKKAKVDD
jgi:hypothetical protein